MIVVKSDLTQGELENYQRSFRGMVLAMPVSGSKDLSVGGLKLKLGPPASFTSKYWSEFILRSREAAMNTGDGRISLPEQRGIIVRAALAVGWVSGDGLELDKISETPAKIITSLAKRIDTEYSDYEFELDRFRVMAAAKAGWLKSFNVQLNVEDVSVFDPGKIESTAKVIRASYKEAVTIDPE